MWPLQTPQQQAAKAVVETDKDRCQQRGPQCTLLYIALDCSTHCSRQQSMCCPFPTPDYGLILQIRACTSLYALVMRLFGASTIRTRKRRSGFECPLYPETLSKFLQRDAWHPGWHPASSIGSNTSLATVGPSFGCFGLLVIPLRGIRAPVLRQSEGTDFEGTACTPAAAASICSGATR